MANRADDDKLGTTVWWPHLNSCRLALSSDTSAAVYKFVPMDYATDCPSQDPGTDGDGTASTPRMPRTTGSRADTFELELVVAIDAAKAGAGGTADIWGWLHPAAGFEDLSTKLSYKMVAQTQDTNEDEVINEDDGDILTVCRVCQLPALPVRHLRFHRRVEHGYLGCQHHHGR